MAEGDVEVWVDGHPLAGVEDVTKKVWVKSGFELCYRHSLKEYLR